MPPKAQYKNGQNRAPIAPSSSSLSNTFPHFPTCFHIHIQALCTPCAQSPLLSPLLQHSTPSPYTELFLKIDISSTLVRLPLFHTSYLPSSICLTYASSSPLPPLVLPLNQPTTNIFPNKLPPNIPPPHKFLIPSFSISAKPPQVVSPKNESITHTIVTTMKKHLGPSLRSPSTQHKSTPKPPPTCPNMSKQALTTSPVKHLLPFSSML